MTSMTKDYPEISEIPAHVPPGLVYDFDYLNAAPGESDAYAHWRQLHDGRPDIFFTPRHGGHWVVIRHEDVAHVLETYADFSSVHQTIPKGSTPHRLPPSEYDPPDHNDFRRLIAPFFTPKAIANLESRARALTISLIERFRHRGECDFANEFALEMPIGLFMSIAALPESDRLFLLGLAEEIVRPTSTTERLRAFETMFGYLRKQLDARRENPGDDVLSALVTGRIDGGRPLTDEESLGMAALMVSAGLDTVASMMSFIAIFLAENPLHRHRLVEHPGDIPNAVEELMRRFEISNLGRMVVNDIIYKGVAMKAGDMVLAPMSSAGLDDRRYPDPLTVDFDRADKKHLNFGKGPHQCIGAFLARTEIRVFLVEWLQRIPDFSIAPGKVPLTSPGSANSVRYLPLVWKA